MLIYTPESLYDEILNNPGITYEQITEPFKEKAEWRAYREAFDELRFKHKIHVVRYTGWLSCCRTTFCYFAADKGSIEVVDTRKDIGIVFEYDPYETRKEALANS